MISCAGRCTSFALDSDENEPDGVGSRTVQAAWLKQVLAASTSLWNIVYFHHAPYSSGTMHGSSRPGCSGRLPPGARRPSWPVTSTTTNACWWMASRILSMEWEAAGSIILSTLLPESQFRYNANYGAMLVTASLTDATFEFYNRTGKLIDQYKLQKP